MTARLALSFDDRDVVCVELPYDAAELLRAQFWRLENDNERRDFAAGMLRFVGRAYAGFLDSGLQRPTEKQVAFAERLAKRLEIEPPPRIFHCRAW